MLQYPHINPIAFHLGPLPVHWYGLMYLFGFLIGWALLIWRVKRFNYGGMNADMVSDLVFYVALGVILGGRIGYMLFYDFSMLIHHPLSLFKVYQGGMSFHGGLIGVCLALWIFSKRKKVPCLVLTDLLAPIGPIGLGLGRLGNFINGELFGRISHLPWAMVFPNGGPYPRHPSMLYECLLEGIVLFTILWVYTLKPRLVGMASGLFLLLYAIFRFAVEFVRQPDPQLGFVAFGWMTRGQELCIPMLIIGIILIVVAQRGDNMITRKTST
jgi:phosphatidylglycerol:prolipoprotein diacylglycerol transferase